MKNTKLAIGVVATLVGAGFAVKVGLDRRDATNQRHAFAVAQKFAKQGLGIELPASLPIRTISGSLGFATRYLIDFHPWILSVVGDSSVPGDSWKVVFCWNMSKTLTRIGDSQPVPKLHSKSDCEKIARKFMDRIGRPHDDLTVSFFRDDASKPDGSAASVAWIRFRTTPYGYPCESGPGVVNIGIDTSTGQVVSYELNAERTYRKPNIKVSKSEAVVRAATKLRSLAIEPPDGSSPDKPKLVGLYYKIVGGDDKDLGPAACGCRDRHECPLCYSVCYPGLSVFVDSESGEVMEWLSFTLPPRFRKPKSTSPGAAPRIG